ncbi:transposable element Tcb2 transposase [Trichonephila clavipes]|nr:transposable element Tcb2 transposase [Trichonephila clavipes]
MRKLPALGAFERGQIVGSRRPTRVPLLNAHQRAALLAWAIEHRDWSLEAWKPVTWSDKSQFRFLNADGRVRIWREVHETMDPVCQFLGDHLHPFMLFFYQHGTGVFQQDNCTSYKSRLATGWLDEHSSDFSVINWSPRSPNLNYIEHIWDVLEQGVKGHHLATTSLTESRTALGNICQVIPLPRHVAAIIKTRGGPTRTSWVSIIQWLFSVYKILYNFSQT